MTIAVKLERQTLTPCTGWTLCSTEEIQGELSVVERYIESIRTAEMPTLAWSSSRKIKVKRSIDGDSTVFLVVDLRDSFISVLSQAFADRNAFIRKIDPETFARSSISDEFLDQLERDIWQRKATKIVTVVVTDGLDANAFEKGQISWRNFVNSFYNRSSLFQSYACRGEVKLGMAHFDSKEFLFAIDHEHPVTRSSTVSRLHKELQNL